MWGRFFIPVLALFYIASQVSLAQFSIIMSIFSLSILVLEVPTGVIADLLGKKRTLIIGRSMHVIEIFLIAFFNGFWVFLIAKIISGIGVSLGSGTGSALLYDTLKKQKREDKHKKISGSISIVSNVSMAIVFIIGAFLFSLSPKLPAIASLPLISLGLILTFFLEEPYKNGKKFNMKNSFTHLKEGLSYFKTSNFVKYLSFFSFFTAAAISITLSMSSAYFKAILIPVSLIGILAFVSSMITAFTSKKAHKWEEKLKMRKSVLYIQLFILVSIFLMALMVHYFGFIFYLLIPFVAGFYGVTINDHINKNIVSSHRATLLSMQSFFENLGIFLLFPLVGHFADNGSFGKSYLIFGLILFAGYILVYFYSRKKFNSGILK